MKPHALTTVLASLLACAGQAAITDQLVTHLTFDNTLEDASGKAHHGTAVGTIGYGTGAVGGGAVKLSFKKDGTAFNYVTLGAPADLNFGTDTDFTISLWVKFSDFIFDPPLISKSYWHRRSTPVELRRRPGPAEGLRRSGEHPEQWPVASRGDDRAAGRRSGDLSGWRGRG
jgi:hypothetical protein